MLTFLEYVQSFVAEDIQFKNAKDQDYTNDPNSLLVFAEKEPDEYDLRGKTHGQMSHAIKHLAEFDKAFVEGIVSKARGIIEKFLQRHPEAFCKIWVDGQGFGSKSGIEAVKSANAGEILNTFDLINDKHQMKGSFLKIETQLKNLAVEMEKRYKEIIESKIAKAVDISNLKNVGAMVSAIKKATVISFRVSQQEAKKDVWLDFSDSSIIIGLAGSTDSVNTMFQFTGLNGGAKKPTIDAFYKKRLVPLNPDVDKALKSI